MRVSMCVSIFSVCRVLSVSFVNLLVLPQILNLWHDFRRKEHCSQREENTAVEVCSRYCRALCWSEHSKTDHPDCTINPHLQSQSAVRQSASSLVTVPTLRFVCGWLRVQPRPRHQHRLQRESSPRSELGRVRSLIRN